MAGAMKSLSMTWIVPHVRFGLRILVVMLTCLFFAAGVPAAATQIGNETGLERGVKAAFLYKFLGYIEWPPAAFPRPDSPYVVGVASADTVASELAELAAGRTVNNRPVTVKRLKEGEPISGVHLLFIGRSAAARQPQLLEAARRNSIATVTETENALAQGSMINFRLTNGRVRFDVSLQAAENANLRLSSRMLSVASTVYPGARR
jgi:hypothetical protein